MNSDGSITLENVTAKDDYSFYIQDSSDSTVAFGIHTFGGCYVDTENSTAILVSNTTQDKKFGTPSWPIYRVGKRYVKMKVDETCDIKVTFDGGKITINKVTAPTPLTDEFYVFGAGGTNWVTGWSQNKGKAEYKMTNSGTIASKTFYNVKGSGCQFKVWNKNQNTELVWSNYDGSKSQNITCSNCASNNICFDLSANTDITVYTDGTNVWAKASAHQKLDDANYYLAGDYNGWHTWTNPYKLTKVDDYTHTITKRWNSSDFTTCAGLSRCKILKGDSDWGNAFVISNIHAESSSFKTKSDCESGDTRIVVDLDGKVQDVTFTIWKDANGNKKVSIVAVDVPDRNVKFYSGSTLVDTKVIKDGSTVTPPTVEAPSAGKVLEGWYENSELSGSKYNFDTPISGGDKTFYAKWIDGVSVTFETYCSQTVPQQAVAIGGKATNPGNLNTIQTQSGNHEVATFKGWYADAACNTQFDFNSTISANTTIYAKWEMRSETFNVVGDLWMYDGTNWNNAKNPSFTRSDDKRSISVSYIAPKGLNRFEVIRGNDWGYKVPMDVNSNSQITINKADGHMNFTLSKIQKVTITYNGRFSVSSEDYTPAFVDNMYITGDAWGTIGGTAMASWGGQDHSNQKLTEENGKGVIVVRDVSANSNHQFKIYGSKGDNSVTGIDVFNAPYVDMVNKPSKLTWQNIGSNSIFGYPIPMSDNQWRNIIFQVSEQIDMKITFDGAVVSMAELPKYTVSFNKNGATSADIPDQTMYEGRKATQPTAPFKPLYKFVKWQLNGEDYDFSTPVTADITLDAVYELASLSIHGPLWRVSADNNDFTTAGTPAFTNNGTTATVSLVAPKGRQTFGILRDRSYAADCMMQASWVEGTSAVNPTTDGMWFHFELTEASYITITYNAAGKVDVQVDKDYTKKDGTFYVFNYPNTGDKTQLVNGEAIIRDLPTSDKDFKITTASGDEGAVNGVSRFGGPFVEIGENKYGMWETKTYAHDWQMPNEQDKFPIVGSEKNSDWADKYWQNAHVHIPTTQLINGKADLKFTFDGKTIRVAPVEHRTVSFNTGEGATTVKAVEAFDGNVAKCPETIPTRTDGASFVEWLYNGESFDWNTPITEDITLTALWDILQDRVDALEDGGTLTLTHDYIGGNVIVNKKMTIDAGGHKIGNLSITTDGDLTLSSAMTANDFVIESSQVEPVSGQLKGADKLTVAGSAYMDLSFGAEAVTAGWYAFTVPFAVSSTGGVYNANTGAKLTNETDYAIMHYQGDVRAQGQYGWIKTHKKGGVMQPGTLYIIAFGDTEYNKIRFKKASGALSTNMVAVHQYGGGTETDNGWNGVGNPSLAYGNATNTGGAKKAQFLDHASNAFVISEQEITDQTYVVSSAFFIQANTDDNMTFTVPDNIGELMAPRRASANKEFMLELSQGAQFQDRLYLSVSEEAKDEYEIGHDLVKMSAVNGNATVAQMAIEGYDMNLCDAEFPMSEEVLFPLVLSAPKAGEYTLSVQRACAEQELFVVNDGVVVWDLKQGDYTLDLQKGTTYDYSLMLQTGERTMPTGTDVIRSANGVQKIILRQELRIIRDGKMFNAQGIEL